MSNPTPIIPGNGGSAEKSLNEILDTIASFYQLANSGGIPVDVSGVPPTPATDLLVSGGPTSCAGAAQTVNAGNALKYNQFNLVSVMFDNAIPRDVKLSIVYGANVRTWVNLVGYTGTHLLLDDKLEGPGFQIRIEVGQYAGAFTHFVSGKER